MSYCPKPVIFPKNVLAPNTANQSRAMRQSQIIQQNKCQPIKVVETQGDTGPAGKDGSSNIISIQTFTSTSDITFPVGTLHAGIMLSGAGGASGNPQGTITGGAGGAGGFVYINRLPMQAGTNMHIDIDINGNTTLSYLQLLGSNGDAPQIAKAFSGEAGQNASDGQGGQGGTIDLYLHGFAMCLPGESGGAGGSTISTVRTINYLSYFNQIFNTSSDYGLGGFSRINQGNVEIIPAGIAACKVVSYSS